jgi:hypothetical protein
VGYSCLVCITANYPTGLPDSQTFLNSLLENLDDLFVTLFKETEHEISEEQRNYLTICERMVAVFYCYIYQFAEAHNLKSGNNNSVGIGESGKNLAYEFYYNAAYELRTPCGILKGYNERPFLLNVAQPPVVPQNQDKLDKINYWIDELWKFTDDLPNLWKATEPEKAAQHSVHADPAPLRLAPRACGVAGQAGWILTVKLGFFVALSLCPFRG